MKTIEVLLLLALFAGASATAALAQTTQKESCDRAWAAADWKAAGAECSTYAQVTDAAAESSFGGAHSNLDPKELKAALTVASPSLLIAGIAWARTMLAEGKQQRATAYDSAYGMAVADLRNAQEYGDSVVAKQAAGVLALVESQDFLSIAPSSALLASSP